MHYDVIPSSETTATTADAIRERGIEVSVVEKGSDALLKIKELIPQGASVMNGASVTLEQIGFVDYLKSGAHGWNNLHEAIVAEKDPAKQAQLRKQATLSDYYLGSVHAIAQTGELVIASNTGSQLPHIVHTSPNLIFVAGTHKIVPTLEDALTRLREYVIPLEDKHMKDIGYGGTMLSKIVIVNRENPMMGRTVRLILVNEKIGF